ncbi:putative Der1 like family [Trypanosoma vivax]|nr:putative Der1 like family [Trypanosoma vivax]
MIFNFIVSVPPVTRVLLALGVVSIVLVTFDLVHPVQMIFSPTLIFQERQYWRLVLTFLYYGRLSLNSIFELHWLYVVSSSIEVQYFHWRRWDYCFTLFVTAALLVLMRTVRLLEAPYLSLSFGKSLMYLFGRLLPDEEVVLFGLVTLQVRLLPLVLFLIGICLSGLSSVKGDMLAYLVGHVLWYFLEIFPRITSIHPLRIQEHFAR